MSPRVSHLLSVTPDPDYPSRDVSHTVRTGGITQTHGATITRVTGGIREVSGGTPPWKEGHLCCVWSRYLPGQSLLGALARLFLYYTF